MASGTWALFPVSAILYSGISPHGLKRAAGALSTVSVYFRGTKIVHGVKGQVSDTSQGENPFPQPRDVPLAAQLPDPSPAACSEGEISMAGTGFYMLLLAEAMELMRNE